MCLAQWSYRKPPDKKVQWLEVMYKMGTSHFRAVSEECLELLGIKILTCSRLSLAGEKWGRAREKLNGRLKGIGRIGTIENLGQATMLRFFNFFRKLNSWWAPVCATFKSAQERTHSWGLCGTIISTQEFYRIGSWGYLTGFWGNEKLKRSPPETNVIHQMIDYINEWQMGSQRVI